ncbi:hypothetical protein [Mucilaginibacter celer]|uniref:Uncharacterized protein n=1 Tax=Mucilaginibacter celer TaxID=2305508 RepID=A0A494VK22_9SPHI|nr:hypothetical protein [Mucilaginibacter celer]AYL94259.1 hypothetical protein HYN43_002650 [Mucilaginibacter celer]
MDLPYQKELQVFLLAGSLNNISATYKFYWFLALLGRVEIGKTTIQKRDLFAEMIAHPWYTVNYLKISFKFLEGYLTIVPNVSLFEHHRVFEI